MARYVNVYTLKGNYMRRRKIKKFRKSRIILTSRYTTKVKTSAKRYDRKRERSINHNPEQENSYV